jgi:hypothetical protein
MLFMLLGPSPCVDCMIDEAVLLLVSHLLLSYYSSCSRKDRIDLCPLRPTNGDVCLIVVYVLIVTDEDLLPRLCFE